MHVVCKQVVSAVTGELKLSRLKNCWELFE